MDEAPPADVQYTIPQLVSWRRTGSCSVLLWPFQVGSPLRGMQLPDERVRRRLCMVEIERLVGLDLVVPPDDLVQALGLLLPVGPPGFQLRIELDRPEQPLHLPARLWVLHPGAYVLHLYRPLFLQPPECTTLED